MIILALCQYLIDSLINQKGSIGFDGDLFAAGKRAENAKVHS
ncbi:hypothetical protein HMPREF1575_00842 [Gardnerella vaginalis JCP7672]|nr:hypothetical protein HMPREF1575_00842 [Gardnerella vaginalis JCP7672]